MAIKQTTKGAYQIVKNEHGSLEAYHGKFFVCGFSHLSVRTAKAALVYMQTIEDEFGIPNPNDQEQMKSIKKRLRELGPRGEISFHG